MCNTSYKTKKVGQWHHHCTSFGNPQFQYCWECEQLVSCHDSPEQTKTDMVKSSQLGFEVPEDEGAQKKKLGSLEESS